jgi:hypothetical protein
MAADNSVVRRQITQQVSPQTVTRIIMVRCVPEACVCSKTFVRLVPTPSLPSTPSETRVLDCRGLSGVHGRFLNGDR